MANPRSQIERIKDELRRKIDRNAIAFRRSIIRELELMYRRARGGNELNRTQLQELIEIVEREFKIRERDKNLFRNEIEQAEAKISEVWNDYFNTVVGASVELTAQDFEKLIALAEVDFPGIEQEQREMILQELRRAVRADYSFDVVRGRLIRRGLAIHHATTLANTGVAQFDNAMMHEFAAQAGIEKFLYDGVLQRNSRPFCIERVGKTFTLAQIRQMNNGQGLPVLTSLGGYNCTHWWTPQLGNGREAV